MRESARRPTGGEEEMISVSVGVQKRLNKAKEGKEGDSSVVRTSSKIEIFFRNVTASTRRSGKESEKQS